jgi:SAM-dependent methyltransferase
MSTAWAAHLLEAKRGSPRSYSRTNVCRLPRNITLPRSALLEFGPNPQDPPSFQVNMAATAIEAWDERWATPEGRDDWLVPHPAVAPLVPVLKARGAQHVLDLGCGVGRHALLFAEHGFAVETIDGATAGLDFACREAAARGLRLSLRQADADALPFTDESFDYVLSWNVIFHGTMGDVGRRLAEIWRVLKPGGLYQGTMLSKRDAQFGRGRLVAPDTFIRGCEPKAHPHYYCDLAALAALFAGFELLS